MDKIFTLLFLPSLLWYIFLIVIIFIILSRLSSLIFWLEKIQKQNQFIETAKKVLVKQNEEIISELKKLNDK